MRFDHFLICLLNSWSSLAFREAHPNSKGFNESRREEYLRHSTSAFDLLNRATTTSVNPFNTYDKPGAVVDPKTSSLAVLRWPLEIEIVPMRINGHDKGKVLDNQLANSLGT